MSRYLEIASHVGSTAAEHGIKLAPGDRFVMRAEHLDRARANSAPLDNAIEAGRVVVRRVTPDEAEAEGCDRAWRALSRPWTLASSSRGDDVRDPGEGLGRATLGGAS